MIKRLIRTILGTLIIVSSLLMGWIAIILIPISILQYVFVGNKTISIKILDIVNSTMDKLLKL